MSPDPTPDARRPIATRSTQWAQDLAAALARHGVSPNLISRLSVLFAAAGALALAGWGGAPGGIVCALCIQLRLICNLMDGMVAIEHRKKTAVGVIYNEVPDRIADSVLIVALGYAAGLGWLGWLGALLAVSTAYVRVLGGSLGLAQDFCGPQSKSQRMAVMTLACVLYAVEVAIWHSDYALLVGLIIISGGGLITCGRRLFRLSRQLERGAQA